MSHHILYKYIYRLMAVLMVLMLVFSAAPAAYAASGSCGDNLSWTLDAGTLTITGSGPMDDYTLDAPAPWYAYRDQILRVVLPEGLTYIGELAFYECTEVTVLKVPDSVKQIGAYAFFHCHDLQMLDLGTGVTVLGECAFSNCYSINALRLPGSLENIGKKAFYRCESISTVTVPASVTHMGMSAFGYCKSLVSADIQARISTIPGSLFYHCQMLTSVTLPETASAIDQLAFSGCDQLAVVYYEGQSRTPEEIQEEIGADVPAFGSTGHVTGEEPPEENRSGTTTENEDGTVTQENTTVTESEEVTVSTTISNTHPEDSLEGELEMKVEVTVESEEGWGEALEEVEDALKEYNEQIAAGNTGYSDPEIYVYVKGTETVDPDFIDALAGRDVVVIIRTPDGSVWRLQGKDLDTTGASADYNLSYTVTTGSRELCEELGVNSCYVLKFHNPAQINAELMIELSREVANEQATLFQRDDQLTQIQTVRIDQNGCIHFYLASVSNEVEYYVAMNLPEPEEEPIIPMEMQAQQGIPTEYVPVQYRITGSKSSWGIGIDMVTWILVGGLVLVVTTVGVVMYMLNRRKLSRGYVPDLYDEDLPEEEIFPEEIPEEKPEKSKKRKKRQK